MRRRRSTPSKQWRASGSTRLRPSAPKARRRKTLLWLEKNIFPEIGWMPISTVKPRDVLGALQKIEARGAIESAHKIKQICGQIFRHAVASGLA
ncbi:phage integrase central domain-containing protein [Massilia psychrophila]|uniref:phage integrase central domain-containing protein n=1 Tax=Massilia psychrophila TaxID=1603353 RepID=UPI003F892CFD